MKLVKEEKIQIVREEGKKPKLVRSGDIQRYISLDKQINDYYRKEKERKRAKRKKTIKGISKRLSGMGNWVENNLNPAMYDPNMGFGSSPSSSKKNKSKKKKNKKRKPRKRIIEYY